MAKRVPKYRRHVTGQAFVQHQSIPTNDHRMYLGVYGTASSRAKYRQFLQQLEAQAEDEQFDLRARTDLTVTELVARYLQHCESYYVDSEGRQTKEFSGNKEAVTPVLALFGEDLARDFGPRKLTALQQRFVALRYSRGVVNQHIGRVKRMFKWASKTELVPAIVYHGLLCVDGLRQGRSKAPDFPEVKPVSWEVAKAVLPYVSPPVAAMIQVQYLCGMRPGEVTIMRRCDIDTSDEIWIYSPARHKNKWRGHSLVKARRPPQEQPCCRAWAARPWSTRKRKSQKLASRNKT